MSNELTRIKNFLSSYCELKISSCEKDEECEEYCGYILRTTDKIIRFRKAKITPKKTGQFVTLWRRNTNDQTEPFDVKNSSDFYLIAVAQDERLGFFLFPKEVLAEKQVLSTDAIGGKRGFRLYSNRDMNLNKQAEKTKHWQTRYFIDLEGNNEDNIKSISSILTIF